MDRTHHRRFSPTARPRLSSLAQMHDSRSYPNLAPRPVPQSSGDDDPTASDSPASSVDGRPKRSGRNPCAACRNSKIKCDGLQPCCSSCFRRGRMCTYQGAGRYVSGAELRRLGHAARVLQRLQSLPGSEAVSLLASIRRQDQDSPPSTPEPSAAAAASPSTRIVLPAAMPAAGCSLEFELAARLPIAYPFLAPLSARELPLDQLLWTSAPFLRNHIGPLRQHDLCAIDQLGLRQKPAVGQLQTLPALTQSIDVAERLDSLDITRWTRLPIPNSMAAGVIALYLINDHPVLPLFDRQLFLNSLLQYESYHCSAFLVNALLAWSCQAFSVADQRAALLSSSFFREAETLWKQSCHQTTLTSVAALQLMSMTATTYGLDDDSSRYAKLGTELGRQMGLFDVASSGDSAASWARQHPDWLRAASHTAWGTFNWMSVRTLHYHELDIRLPPLLPMPGDLEPATSAASPSSSNAMCKLFLIFHDMARCYYGAGKGLSVNALGIEAAEDIYRRLLNWASSLPQDHVRGEHAPHHITLMHVYFHAIVTDLFRPFLYGERRPRALSTFVSSQADAAAAYHASVKHLQRLLLKFRLHHRAHCLSVLWQTAAIYVLNAALRDASDPKESSDAGFYVRLSLAALRELASMYRAFASVAIGGLGMARKSGVLAAREVGRATRELLLLAQSGGGHSKSSSNTNSSSSSANGDGNSPHDRTCVSAAVADEPNPQWVLDLDLAVLDSKGARGGNVVRVVRDVVLEAAAGHGDEQPNVMDEYHYGQRQPAHLIFDNVQI